MEETGVNDKIIDVCRRMLGKQGESDAPQVNEGVESECVLLCNRVGPGVFDIKKGIAKVVGVDKANNGGQAIVSHAIKTIFLIE